MLLPLKAKRRRARGYVQRGNLRQQVQQFLRQSVGHIFLILVRGHVQERQDRDRVFSGTGDATILSASLCSTNLSVSSNTTAAMRIPMIQRSSFLPVWCVIDSRRVDLALALQPFGRELVEPGECDEERKADRRREEKPAHRPIGQAERPGQLRNALCQRPHAREIERAGTKDIAATEFDNEGPHSSPRLIAECQHLSL